MPEAAITIKHLDHKNEHQIGLYCQYDPDLTTATKGIEGVQWSRSNRCWYIKNSPENLRKIYAAIKGKAWIDKGDFFSITDNTRQKRPAPERIPARQFNKIPPEYTGLLIRRRYSDNTIRTYQHFFSRFINHFPGLNIDDLTEDHIRKFQDYLVKEKKVALSTQNQAINSIKFYYEKVLQGERKTYYIERPGKEKKLPSVLSKEQIKSLLGHNSSKTTEIYTHVCATDFAKIQNPLDD
jgi:integrase/recombinase XerD